MEEVAQELRRTGLVDVHCHLLPGLDDGPADVAESVVMARILADAGYSEVWCTPHLIKGYFEAPSAAVRAAVESLQQELDAAGIPLKLHPAREYHLDEFLPSLLEDPLPINGKHLLVEPPFHGNPAVFPEAIFPVIRKGLTPLLAHPERCTAMEPGDPVVSRLQEMGCELQLNVGSFAGNYGESVRHKAARFLESGVSSVLGTDAHSPFDMNGWLKKGIAAAERGGSARFAVADGPPFGTRKS